MSLAEIIADVASHHQKEGVFDRDAAIEEALPRVMADPHSVESIVRSALGQRIKQHWVKVQDAAMQSFASGQMDMFGLRHAHVLAGDENIIKSTRAMTRIEFTGLIKLRQQQVNDDTAYLDRLKFAADETAMIWDRHPNWSWGQVQDAYGRMKKAA